MDQEAKNPFLVSLFMPMSGVPTDANRTGSWAMAQPRYQEKTAPCSEACPCGQDIPRIEMLTAQRRLQDAWRTILVENPLPGACGRVCFHPCQKACNRGEFDSPISIHSLERFLDDNARREALSEGWEPSIAKGKRIAMVGSGPAGLSAAYFLTRLGYECEILEAEKKAGGLLRYGIPAYRLPEDVLQREIARIERLGVRIRCSCRIDEKFLASARDHYDAVFVACGNGHSLGLRVAGETLAVDGLAFLSECRKAMDSSAEPKDIYRGKTAAVVGGGNSAIDVARTLLRLGSQPTLVYRRRREDMPAFAQEITHALEEGVRLVELRAPLSLSRVGDRLQLQTQKMRITEIGTDGRMRVGPITGAVESLVVDAVYAAIGAEAEEPWKSLADSGERLCLSHSRMYSGEKYGIPFVLGGDLVNREESVADAIASGKEAAIALDAYFQGGLSLAASEVARCRIGDGNALSMEIYSGGPRRNRSGHVVGFDEINPDYFEHSESKNGCFLAANVSTRSFDEIEAGLDADTAVCQAERCFQCGICNDCDHCRTFCPELAVRVTTGYDRNPSAISGSDRRILADYCKGCGICVTECPRNAMLMEESEA